MRCKQHRAKLILHHPLTRTAIFAVAILISLTATDYLVHEIHATVVGAIGVGPLMARLVEVFADLVCDRVFPEF
jgi:hypothetical protein